MTSWWWGLVCPGVFVRRLQQLGWTGSLAMVEAGRGPGGRSASRLRRGDSDWCLDHGAPGFNLLDPHEPKVAALLDPLRASGVLRREWGDCLGVDEEGEVVSRPDHSFLSGNNSVVTLDGWGLSGPFWMA